MPLKIILTTAEIDAYEDHDEVSADVPNYVIQTETPNLNEQVILNITGVMVYLLTEMNPEV